MGAGATKLAGPAAGATKPTLVKKGSQKGSQKTLARGNWEQVEKAVQIARLAGREPATPDEAREILSLPARESS